jgi:hypothetical protein
LAYSIDEIIHVVVKKTGCRSDEVKPGTDIFQELGCIGDDFHELMQDYAKQFKVDMSTYLWYFHADEEGQNFGALFFKPPYKRVVRIPVTPEILLASANAGKWLIGYPEHKLPTRRYDMIINYVFIILVVSFILYQCSK